MYLFYIIILKKIIITGNFFIRRNLPPSIYYFIFIFLKYKNCSNYFFIINYCKNCYMVFKNSNCNIISCLLIKKKIQSLRKFSI